MDSEHRHELKQNELADWIYHAPEYFRKNAQWIAAVVLVIAAAVVLKISLSKRAQADISQQAQATNLITGVDVGKALAIEDPAKYLADDPFSTAATDLKTQALQTKSDSLAALTLIKAAAALRAKLHYTPDQLTIETIEGTIEEARKAYNDALAKAVGTPNEAELTAMANFGLGLCSEELGQYEQAAGIYQQIIDNEKLEGTIFPKQAALRMETMLDSKGSYTFVDAPPPAPAPVTRPPRTPQSNYNPLLEPKIPNLNVSPKPDPKTETASEAPEPKTEDKTEPTPETEEAPKTDETETTTPPAKDDGSEPK